MIKGRWWRAAALTLAAVNMALLALGWWASKPPMETARMESNRALLAPLSAAEKEAIETRFKREQSQMPCLKWEGLNESERQAVMQTLTAAAQGLSLESQEMATPERWWAESSIAASEEQAKGWSQKIKEQGVEGFETKHGALGWIVSAGPWEQESQARQAVLKTKTISEPKLMARKEPESVSFTVRFGPWPMDQKDKLETLARQIPGSEVSACSSEESAQWMARGASDGKSKGTGKDKENGSKKEGSGT